MIFCDFGTQHVAKLEPIWAQNRIKKHQKINAKFDAKMNQNGARNGRVGGRGVARCGGGEGEVNLPLSSEEDGFEEYSHTPNPVLRKLCGGLKALREHRRTVVAKSFV